MILDMDGLMLDTEPISWRAWTQAARSLGFELTDDLFDLMVGRPAPANARMLVARFGADCPVPALMEAAAVTYRALLDVEGVPHKRGLTSLLDFLDDRHVPRAVATSTATVLARHKLQQAAVLHRLHEVVGGDRVANGKPAPDIFLEAAASLELPPDACVVLEDSEAGVLGAAAAGMRPILVPDLQSPSPAARAASYAVVDSLEAAIPLIAALLGTAAP